VDVDSQVRSLHHRTSMPSSSSSRVVSAAARDWEGPVALGRVWVRVQLVVGKASRKY
jgi:hypothetical protein